MIWLAVLPLLLTACAAPNSRSAWDPMSAELLLTSGRDGNGEIYLLRAGQGEWTNLTQHEASDNWPNWSPDASRIVFQSRRSGNLDVWCMNADGSEPVQLTDDPEPDYLPSWSPDGHSIVFTSWRQEGEEERVPHLYVMNADGSAERRLVAESPNTSAGGVWSGDGKWLIYSRQTGESGADLFVCDAEGQHERRLTHDGERDIYNGSPVFSPDGKWIAFYSSAADSSALVVIDREGGQRRTVLAEGQNWYPRWSPDGEWLVYTAAASGGDEGNTDVWAIAVSGDGEPILLAGGDRRELEASWRPN
jgi:TolB protein